MLPIGCVRGVRRSVSWGAWMALKVELSTTERLLQLFDHLGIERAHLAGGMREIVGLPSVSPERVASVTMVCTHQPVLVEPLRRLAPRLLFVHGDTGPSAPIVPRALPALPGATDVLLSDFFDVAWCDPVADRGAEIGAAMLAFLASTGEAAWIGTAATGIEEGEVAGISY